MNTEFLVIGGGPAGLSAGLKAAKYGVKVLIVDDGISLGGQLIKQTHKFFGSINQFASIRGIEIADKLIEQGKQNQNIRMMERTTVVGYYDDGSFIATRDDKSYVINAQRVLVATGAAERVVPFRNNDLPGVYGAGAVQTLMNLYGVLPGENVLMIGAGNIGLIVSYQLLQAGSKMVGVAEATSRCGGYWVHAAKLKRIGIPIWTNTTIVEALGDNKVRGARLAKVDKNFSPISGSEFEVACDTICLAVGLNPLVDLLWQAGCEMAYIPELGGDIPLRNEDMETTRRGFYVAGDAAAIEEATSAMLEGELVGLAVANSLGYKVPDYNKQRGRIISQLKELRGAEISQHIRKGIEKLKQTKNYA